MIGRFGLLACGCFLAGIIVTSEAAAQNDGAAAQVGARSAAAIPGNPPRIGVAGKTGTYLIVFSNSATVTLDRVELWYENVLGKPPRPYFKTYYKGGQTGLADFSFKTEQVEGIFLLKEDLNTN